MSRLSHILSVVIIFLLHSCADFNDIVLSNGDLCIDKLKAADSFPIGEDTGSGTKTDPYYICTVAQYNLIGSNSSLLNKHFILQADIDFTGKTPVLIGQSAANSFSGSLTGNGFSIKNLDYTTTRADYTGLFAYATGATFRNLKFSNITFTHSSTADQSATGLLAGFLSGGIVQNITFEGITLESNKSNGIIAGVAFAGSQIKNIEINSSIIKTEAAAGGIAGLLLDAASVSNVSLNIELSNLISADLRLGGVAGLMQQGSTVTQSIIDVTMNCTGNTDCGAVTGILSKSTVNSVTTSGTINTDTGNAGGIAASSGEAAAILNSESKAVVYSANETAGGIVASASNTNIKYTKFSGKVTSAAGTATNVGGIAGAFSMNSGETAVIEHCIMSGSVTGSGSSVKTGGITGSFTDNNTSSTGRLRRNLITGTVSGTATTKAILTAALSVPSATDTVTFNLWSSDLSTLNAIGGGTDVSSAGNASKTDTELADGATYSIWDNFNIFYYFPISGKPPELINAGASQ